MMLDLIERDELNMRGPSPKPTALKLLAGNPGKRPLNESEPTPPAGAPNCPRELSKEAKKEWKRIAPLLYDMGVLSTIDIAALAAYCECWSRWRDAERNIAKYGAVIKTPTGYPIQSPYVSIATKAIEQMRRFLSEFGMTPASRSRISAGPPPLTKPNDSQDPLDFLVQ
jgi:P27 family predicted phage terminase small subunit